MVLFKITVGMNFSVSWNKGSARYLLGTAKIS